MILDLLILVLLIMISMYPSMLNHFYTIPGKIILVACILGLVKINPLLSIIAGIVYMTHIPYKETFSPKLKIKHSLLSLDESIRPKNSNRISVVRLNEAPPREDLSGSIPLMTENNNTGVYTPF
jgi:hypothetical protein